MTQPPGTPVSVLHQGRQGAGAGRLTGAAAAVGGGGAGGGSLCVRCASQLFQNSLQGSRRLARGSYACCEPCMGRVVLRSSTPRPGPALFPSAPTGGSARSRFSWTSTQRKACSGAGINCGRHQRPRPEGRWPRHPALAGCPGGSPPPHAASAAWRWPSGGRAPEGAAAGAAAARGGWPLGFTCRRGPSLAFPSPLEPEMRLLCYLIASAEPACCCVPSVPAGAYSSYCTACRWAAPGLGYLKCAAALAQPCSHLCWRGFGAALCGCGHQLVAARGLLRTLNHASQHIPGHWGPSLPDRPAPAPPPPCS